MGNQYSQNKIAERQIKFKINKLVDYYIKKCGKLEIKKVDHIVKDNTYELNVIELKYLMHELKNKLIYNGYNKVWTLYEFNKHCKENNIQNKTEELKKNIKEFNILSEESVWFTVIDNNKEVELTDTNIKIIQDYFDNLLTSYLVHTDSNLPYIDLNSEKPFSNKYIEEYIDFVTDDNKFDEYFSLSDSLFMMQRTFGVIIAGGKF